MKYVLSGLENGQGYELKILARNNEVGDSDWSNTVGTTPRTIPSSPTISTITNSQTHGDAVLTVSWTAGATGGGAITSYDLRYIRSDAPDKADNFWTEVPDIWTTGGGTLEYALRGLAKGVEHDIEVRAVNNIGDGGWSTTYSQTPKTAPGEPGTPTLEEDDEELAVTWHAPGDTGGVAITGYSIRYIESDDTEANKNIDSNWTEEAFAGSLSDLEHTIANLTNGTEYDVQVRAVNSEGDGLWSKTRKGTPRTIPGAPTLNALTPGHRILTLHWTAPSDNGGATITSYHLQFKESDDEDIPANWDEVSPIWASGDLEYGFKPLVNGTGYDIQVRAYNEAGEGPWSNKESATPHTTPGAPKIVPVTPGNAELTVTWAAPNDNGGDDVSSYNLRYIHTDATPQQKDDDAAWTPKTGVGTPTNRADTITGLDNGVEYDVQVQAVNAAGGGGWSDTEPGTPRTTPDAPTITSHNSGDESLTVLWSRPGDGGATISGYDLRYIESDATEQEKADDNEWTVRDSVWTSGNLEYTLSGLTNGTQYDVQMRAGNAAGDGSWSDTRQGTPETVPEAPTVDSLEAGDTTLKVTWSPPADTGGGTLESYNLRHIPNDETDKSDATGPWITVTGVGDLANREYTITDLTNGVLYDVQLQAVTSVDPGPWSGTSSGTPRTTPGAVGAPSLAPGNQSLTVSWSVPSDDGGAAPTSYDLRYILTSEYETVDANWTEQTDVGTSSSMQETISGLDNGTGYDVQVRAVNSAGDGDWSDASSSTPRTRPSAPTIDTVTVGSSQLSVAWSTSPDNGGDAVSSYDLRYIKSEATSRDDDLWEKLTTVGSLNIRVHIVENLENGTEYEVQVRAVNGAGGDAWSASGFGTPAATGAPTNVQLTAARTSITVTWDPPAQTNGVTITGYQVRYINTDNLHVFDVNGDPPDRSHTMSGLASGVQYDVQVRTKTSTGLGAWSDTETVTTTGGSSGGSSGGNQGGTPPSQQQPPGTTTPPGTTIPPAIAQNLPGTPTVSSVTAGETSLVVAWTAPDQGNAPAVSNYDIRYIRTDADETLNYNWALRENVWSGSGSLEYTITGLASGTEYDVQVRAVNSVGDGPWSATSNGTTTGTETPLPTTGCETDLGTLTGAEARSGTWANDCDSTGRSGSYARFYNFTLSWTLRKI